jgi:prepilin-type N-terminal cleavage/methylation domain-containing protein
MRHYLFLLRHNKHSFTLIELILALGIFSIISLSLYGSFWTGMKIHQRSQNNTDVVFQIIRALKEISQEMEKAVYFSSETFKAFEGLSQEIIFLVPSSQGLQQIRYFLMPAEDTPIYQLIFKEQETFGHTQTFLDASRETRFALMREESALTAQSSKEQEVLSLDIASGGLKFYYAYIDIEKDPPTIEWKDAWEQEYLPAGIKIQLTFLDPQSALNRRDIERFVYLPTGFWGQVEK